MTANVLFNRKTCKRSSRQDDSPFAMDSKCSRRCTTPRGLSSAPNQAMRPAPNVTLATTKFVVLLIVGCLPGNVFAKPLILFCDNGALVVISGCLPSSWPCMLLVGSKYAKVVAVASLALILPDPPLKSTLLLVRLAEVTVVAAPVIVACFVPICVWTLLVIPERCASSASATTELPISPPEFVTTALEGSVFLQCMTQAPCECPSF